LTDPASIIKLKFSERPLIPRLPLVPQEAKSTNPEPIVADGFGAEAFFSLRRISIFEICFEFVALGALTFLSIVMMNILST